MARVKICPSCLTPNDPGTLFCSTVACGYGLSDVEVVEATAAAVSSDAPAPPPGATWSADDCEGAIAAMLEFPWGPVQVVDALFVGRDPHFSTLAEHLEHDYRWVSGRHAEIYADGAELHVRDMGSTNGTYVNGTRIESRRPVPLHDGDLVAFSRRLVATVRMTS
jgi:FHA domain